MTAIPWTVVDPETIERIIAVGLCRRYSNARRIRPSQGDGGLDVLVPTTQSRVHVDNYQVKKFADGLNESRKRQIRTSLETAITTHRDSTSPYTISTWYLAIPMDLTREQETWLSDLAEGLDCPFPVATFTLTEIEELLSDSPDIREYYLGDGMEKISAILRQMTSLADLQGLTTDQTRVSPDDASVHLEKLHQAINAVDPHFNYDYEVTTQIPVITPRAGLVASIIARTGPNAPHVAWHIYVKYDEALDDRPIPGSYTVHPDRMTPEQREAWDRWLNYGTPVTLEGGTVDNWTIDLPGGLGGDQPIEGGVMRIGPAYGEFDEEPVGRSRWTIENAGGAELAEVMFAIRRTGAGIAGGTHLRGTDPEGYIDVDLYVMPELDTGVSLKVKLDMHSERWINQPVQRVLPSIRFCAAWGAPNSLRPRDEFGLQVSSNTLTLTNRAPIPPALLLAVEDLARISEATKKSILLPPSMEGLVAQNGLSLHVIADALADVDTEFGVSDLVVWYEDKPGALESLTSQATSGSLTIPWKVPFPLIGEDFELEFRLSVTGDFSLVPDVPTDAKTASHKAVRLIATASTRARLRWTSTTDPQDIT